MAENTEGRLKRALDRLFPSPPPEPRLHSAAGSTKNGVSFATKFSSPTRDQKGIISPGLSENVRFDTSPNSGFHRICRPWDRGDLFRRLATFKSMTWFGKPKLADPVSCARKGWVNIDVDLISCEGCNAVLSFPTPLTWSQHEAEEASASFSEKLDSGHKALCPWKENACSETLAQFPPASPEVLAEGFKDRCKKLSQLPALPVISDSAIDFFRTSKGSQIDCLLLQSVPDFVASNRIHDDISINTSLCAYNNAQKLISICGWEPRMLPYVVDSVDDNTGFIVSEIKTKQQKPSDLEGRLLITPSKKEGVAENWQSYGKALYRGSRQDVGSGVLDCSLCGASVGLWLFNVVTPPAHVVQNATAPGISGASGSELGSSDSQKLNQKVEIPKKADVATVTSVKHSLNVVNLKLTIAGGPPPTRLLQDSQRGAQNHSKNASELYYGSQINVSTSFDKNYISVNKRKREELTAVENNPSKLRILHCISSVDAVDTSFVHNRQENSAESVEMPHNMCTDTTINGVDNGHITISNPIINPKPTDELGIPVDTSSSINNAMRKGNGQELDDNDVALKDARKKSGKSVLPGDKTMETCSPIEDQRKRLWQEDMNEFDPILQHRHFCPWVNANIGRGLCGWQLTLDALEPSTSLSKSESASSMYNADPLSSVRNILGKSWTSPKLLKK